MIHFWRCDMCGRKREDHDIEVLTYRLKSLPGGERNLKYCADNDDCYNKAMEKSKTGEL